jgi:hypothetical protein
MKPILILLLAVLSFSSCTKDTHEEMAAPSSTDPVATDNIPVPSLAYRWTKIPLSNPNAYPYNWTGAPNLLMKANENKVYLQGGGELDHAFRFSSNTRTWSDYPGYGRFNLGYQYLFSYDSQIYFGLLYGNEFENHYFGVLDPVYGVSRDRATFPGHTVDKALCFVVGNKGYVIAGYSATTPRRIWEYDFATDQWTLKGDSPLGNRHEAVAFVHNNKVYMGLGYLTSTINGIPVTAYARDWKEYDPATGVTITKASFPGVGRSRAKGFVLNNNIYVGIGKSFTGSLNDFWRYNPSSNTWTQQPDWPSIGESNVDNIATFSMGTTGYLVKAALNEFWQFSTSSLIPTGN